MGGYGWMVQQHKLERDQGRCEQRALGPFREGSSTSRPPGRAVEAHHPHRRHGLRHNRAELVRMIETLKPRSRVMIQPIALM
jgi:hypothetical protein